MQKEKALYVEALARDVAKRVDAVIVTLSV